MKQILKGCIFKTETISIRNNTPIVDYLTKTVDPNFIVQHVSKEFFKQLQEFDYKKTKKIIDVPYNNFIVGYAPCEHNGFREDGGLKLSDDTNGILGQFIIDDKKIIYDPLNTSFNQERDSYVYMYSPNKFYTDLTMSELLIELLKRKRKLLVYMGTEYNYIKENSLWKTSPKEIFEEIDKNQMIEYATNPEKGKQVYTKYRSRYISKR